MSPKLRTQPRPNNWGGTLKMKTATEECATFSLDGTSRGASLRKQP